MGGLIHCFLPRFIAIRYPFFFHALALRLKLVQRRNATLSCFGEFLGIFGEFPLVALYRLFVLILYVAKKSPR